MWAHIFVKFVASMGSYLANLEMSISGGCDKDGYGYRNAYSDAYHEITDECDTEVSLKRVVELEGIEVAQDLDLDDETFIQTETLDETESDEDYPEFTGNEGVSATYFYY
jgi:hypothetical protein